MTITSGLWKISKAGALVAVLVIVALGLTEETGQAGASHTQIFLSYSNVAPIPVTSIILNPGGEPLDVYIWAKGVDSTTGVASYTLALTFDETKISVSSASGDVDGIGDGAWLASTGRGASCASEQGTAQPGRIVGACLTIGVAPNGPDGTGLLGHLVLESGAEPGSDALLAFVEPALGVLSTHLEEVSAETATIPAALMNSTVLLMRCADNSGSSNPPPNGDGLVDLPNDILGVILNYTGNDSFAPGDPTATGTPGIMDNYDLNLDLRIDLANDILGTILQYGTDCWQ